MSEPFICCICPAHREEFLDRAIRCYREQTYEGAFFLILDNADPHLNDRNHPWEDVIHVPLPEMNGKTVGALRNSLVRMSNSFDAEVNIIAHFDMDDWSAPDRLSIQLAHIQKTGKFVTGFYDMTMYDTRADKVWIYTNTDKRYALGTSLFYKREAWERVKFPDATPEDNKWRIDVGLDNCESQSSIREDGSPVMIQVVHGGNASARIIPSNGKFKEASESQAKAVREILRNA